MTLDVNQVISPTLAVRFDGLYQDANVAGRNYVTDDRWGGLAAAKWTPTDFIKVTANYVHTDLNGLPDFGVPYNRALRAPSTDINVPRETYYGFLNRDFQKAKQDFGTITTEVQVAPFLTLTNKSRRSARSSIISARCRAIRTATDASTSPRKAAIRSPTCSPMSATRPSSSTPDRSSTRWSPAPNSPRKRSCAIPMRA